MFEKKIIRPWLLSKRTPLPPMIHYIYSLSTDRNISDSPTKACLNRGIKRAAAAGRHGANNKHCTVDTELPRAGCQQSLAELITSCLLPLPCHVNARGNGLLSGLGIDPDSNGQNYALGACSHVTPASAEGPWSLVVPAKEDHLDCWLAIKAYISPTSLLPREYDQCSYSVCVSPLHQFAPSVLFLHPGPPPSCPPQACCQFGHKIRKKGPPTSLAL